MTTTNSNNSGELRVWDWPVRLFHWLLVLAFIGSYVTHLLGVSYFQYHVWCGYTVLVLVVFRIVWGFFGIHYALFINFVRGPRAILQYARFLMHRDGDSATPGHNPLGAIMVILLLLVLLVQAVTGLFANDEIFNTGPLYGYLSNDLSLWLTGVHQQLFYWIAAAVAVHVLAVLFHLLWHKENLSGAMLTGTKIRRNFPSAMSIVSSRWPLALLLVLLIAGALVAVIITAPNAGMDMDF
jgi:cytochrome b